ncbi:MAG: methyl-accepting chemotaxis protein [Bacillaceae bacterium]|nr:methyl-accepting chemotaxis protein [Bacillaceae bacterium]
MKLNIKAKLILISLALLVIPGLIIGVIAYQIAENELNDAGATGLQNNVRMVKKMIATLDEEVQKGTLTLEEAQERVKVQILGEKNSEGKRPVDKTIDLGARGYFTVVDQKGNTLAHPAVEGKNMWDFQTQNGFYFIRDFIKKAQEGGGFTYYEWPLPDNPDKLAPKISYSELDPHWGWVISAGSYMEDYNSGATRILQVLMLTLGIALVVGIVVIYMFAGRMGTPIVQITEKMKQLADGNLAISQMKVRSKDEIGQLSEAMNAMVDNLRSLIKDASTISEKVTGSSEELTASSNQITQGIEQVSATTEELAAGATTQAEQAGSALEIMQQIDEEIKQINASATEMEESSRRGDEASRQGAESAHQSIEQMQIIEQKVSQSANVVFTLSEKSKEISEILKVINEIAEQTNLLALNAAIEAARAGEQGRGFAVVADEVRKLAEQAGKSTNEIADIVHSVLKEAEEAGTVMQEAVDQVKEGSEVIETNGKTFEEIAAIIQEMGGKIQQVSMATEQITGRVEQGVKAVEDIAAVTEESSAGTEELSASMEQQNASMQEINSMAENLAQMAEELNQSLSRFKM